MLFSFLIKQFVLVNFFYLPLPFERSRYSPIPASAITQKRVIAYPSGTVSRCCSFVVEKLYLPASKDKHSCWKLNALLIDPLSLSRYCTKR